MRISFIDTITYALMQPNLLLLSYVAPGNVSQ